MTGSGPSVLVVGGFLTVPMTYRPLRRRLLARGASRVDIAAIWPTDWALAGAVGFGPLLRRVGRAVVATYRAGGGRPIMIVAHSAGGIVSRLAMSSVPFRGRVAGVAEAVGALVTLGTPHGLDSLGVARRHAGHDAAAFLEDSSPGAFFAPRTGYLTVGSRAFQATERPRSVAEKLRRRAFAELLGPAASTATGDGIVPEAAVHLDGARQLTLATATHGILGRSWYGDELVVDEWWPAALEVWRGALAARPADTRPVSHAVHAASDV